jgi:hypothetical protein
VDVKEKEKSTDASRSKVNERDFLRSNPAPAIILQKKPTQRENRAHMRPVWLKQERKVLWAAQKWTMT